MRWRWFAALSVALGIVAVAIGGAIWLKQATSRTIESVRLARVTQQVLEQQLSLLQSPQIQPILAGLDEDIAALQIRLVELLTQESKPVGLLDVAYEQSVLPGVLEDSHGESVNVLRLNLRLMLRHSLALVSLLNRIDDGVSVWPYETRACELQRLPDQRLSAQCVLDFYHWSRQSVSPANRAALTLSTSTVDGS